MIIDTELGIAMVDPDNDVGQEELEWISRHILKPPMAGKCPGKITKRASAAGGFMCFCDHCGHRSPVSLAGFNCFRAIIHGAMLGMPGTRWPGSVEVSRFTRWANRCPNVRGNVAILGRLGAKDQKDIRSRCNSLKLLDPRLIATATDSEWPAMMKGERFDLVLAMLVAPGSEARVLDLVVHGGVLKTAVNLPDLLRWKGAEINVWSKEVPGWGTCWHAVRREKETTNGE